MHGGECFEMIVIGIITVHVDNGIIRRQAGQNIDMAVGIIAGQMTMIQPQYPCCTKLFTQLCFNLSLG